MENKFIEKIHYKLVKGRFYPEFIHYLDINNSRNLYNTHYNENNRLDLKINIKRVGITKKVSPGKKDLWQIFFTLLVSFFITKLFNTISI